MTIKRKDITYTIEENGCWICTSHIAIRGKGYLGISIDGKMIGLHRHMYELHKGSIKEGNLIRHTCDNRKCINPEHLIEGTVADNSRDMVERDRSMKGLDCILSKLTEQQVLEIFNNNTDSNAKLGRKYRTSGNNIKAIREGKTWKHVTSKIN